MLQGLPILISYPQVPPEKMVRARSMAERAHQILTATRAFLQGVPIPGTRHNRLILHCPQVGASGFRSRLSRNLQGST